jgi:iron complex outermembrane receptor protein
MKKSKNKPNVLLALAVSVATGSVSLPVYSIDNGGADNRAAKIPSVIVSAARTEQSTLTTPASITVITRKQIENSGARHVVDVLRAQGGVRISDLFGDGSRASVGMRGFSTTAGSNTLVLVDGRRLNNIDISSPDLNSVSLKDVERIEIVQGSGGVLFGDGEAVGAGGGAGGLGLGGSVDIETIQPMMVVN